MLKQDPSSQFSPVIPVVSPCSMHVSSMFHSCFIPGWTDHRPSRCWSRFRPAQILPWLAPGAPQSTPGAHGEPRSQGDVEKNGTFSPTKTGIGWETWGVFINRIKKNMEKTGDRIKNPWTDSNIKRLICIHVSVCPNTPKNCPVCFSFNSVISMDAACCCWLPAEYVNPVWPLDIAWTNYVRSHTWSICICTRTLVS